jgi:hypothetical protein
MKFRQIIAAGSILVLSVLSTSAGATVQDDQYRLAHASGQGKIKVGQEEFKVTGVVVKLLNDQKAELTLISEISFYLTGTWSRTGDSKDEFDLAITGGASPGGLAAAGKVTIGDDNKSNIRLILKGKSTTTKKQIEVYFLAK